ncbi:hypothetical protein GCM10009808_09830 [Microbacterium sediminicola]|uniref:NHL repeat-containing protein n=1 Tax=Microbacterium sediminicola TaxID=415210 RepID=A0ABP4TXL5_9MICO
MRGVVNSGVGAAGMLAAVGLVLAGCAASGPSSANHVDGVVVPVVAEVAAGDWSVSAWVAGDGENTAEQLGTATSAEDGAFSVSLGDVDLATSLVYVLATQAGDDAATFATVVPADGSAITLNERTTVATAYSLAQFTGTDGVSGVSPGLPNAASMIPNFVDLTTGDYGAVLTSSPNGNETTALASFTSLANMLTACTLDTDACAVLMDAAGSRFDEAPADTFQAFAAIARDPGAEVSELYDLSLAVAGDRPGLTEEPSAWTLALRFDGDGETLDGPGTFAVDPEGNVWVNNNYEYGADPTEPVCASDLVLEFSPAGEMIGTYAGGGLSGSGFGIAFDPSGQLWLSNFGFAGEGCDEQPPHNSLSLFTTDGTPLSPADTGFTAGELAWPQGVDVTADGSVWTANCQTGTVTVYPGGDPEQAMTLSAGLDQAFGVVDNGRHVFVSGIASSSVAVFDYDGTLVGGAPLTGDEFVLPMGVASDPEGNVWVANSGSTTLPCPERPISSGPTGSVALISADGTTVSGPFSGGGVTRPWGITTDGDGNVWVANFADQRVSAFCGTNPETCPGDLSTGDAISPDDTGYGFNGLVRNTGLIVDPSGNVWVANNWEEVPIQSNPGGHQLVVFVGLAAPVEVAPFTG